MAYNATLPSLPAYSLSPRPPLLPPVPDNVIALVLPVVAYWTLSMAFHLIDVYDWFPQYRLHTPVELQRRNRVPQYDVVRDVVLQHVIQTIVGLAVACFDPVEYVGGEEYDVAVWARRIRIAQRGLPRLLALFGIDALSLAKAFSRQGFTVMGEVFSGGVYPTSVQRSILGNGIELPAFAPWELSAASFIYWWLIPTLQFAWGFMVVDTWQYFWHRAMHLNPWLYCKYHAHLFWFGKGSNVLTIHSQIPFPTSSLIRPLRLWCSLQPSRGGVHPRYRWNRRGLFNGWHDQPAEHGLLHGSHHQNRR